MEEADFLCDRVGIMASGALQCLGVSDELKLRYGAGYKLGTSCPHRFEESVRRCVRACVRAKAVVPPLQVPCLLTAVSLCRFVFACVLARLSLSLSLCLCVWYACARACVPRPNPHSFVTHMLPNARLQKHIGHTSYYEVPRSDVELATLFEQFEANKQRLGLDDWGISETSSVMTC